MAAFRQADFSGGEVAPELWGRSDLSIYGRALKECVNFIPTPQGPLLNRPGTKHLGNTKVASHARLIPFIYSDAQSYVLELGPIYIRIWSNGALVTSGGVPIEFVTPYLLVDLFYLKFAQVGDVMTITCPGRPPYELKRVAHTTWTFSQVSLAAYPKTFPGANPALDKATDHAADATHFDIEWMWLVTAILSGPDGQRIETLGHLVSQTYDTGTTVTAPMADNRQVVYPDRPATLIWSHGGTTGPYGGTSGYTFKGYRIYKGRGEAFGFIGQTTSRTFTDFGVEPDYLDPPPRGRNPMNVDGYAFQRYPATVAFFEERRVFANMVTDPGAGTPLPGLPGTAHFSSTGDYVNFDIRFPQVVDGAIEVEMASRRREEIRALIPFKELLLFTNASIYSLAGGGGAPLTFESVVFRLQSEIGSTWLDPVVAGETVLYSRAKGQGVRAFRYTEQGGGFAGEDISLQARHLFERRQKVHSWAWQEDPMGILWMALDDGTLVSLTYSEERKAVAWARHELGGENVWVHWVCVVPENEDTDVVYLMVTRTVNGSTRYCVERLSDRRIQEAEEAVILDSSITYSGAATEVVGGLSHLEGEEVWALADGEVVGPLTVSGGQVHLGVPYDTVGAEKVHVGLRYYSTATLLDLAEARTKQKTVERVLVEVKSSLGLHVGETEDSLLEVRSRDVSQGYGPSGLRTETIEKRILNTWNVGGSIVVQQQAPLPITILGVTREVKGGG